MACSNHSRQAHMVVCDDSVASFPEDLTRVNPEIVTFKLEKNPEDIKGLQEALTAVTQKKCKVRLCLDHQWRQPTAGASDSFLTTLIQAETKCEMMAFAGCLSSQMLMALPPTINELKLAFCGEDEHMRAALGGLTDRVTSLKFLSLHVVAGTPLSMLHEVKGRAYGPHLVMSGVGDEHVEWACNTARALQFQNSWWAYWTFTLANSGLSKNGCEQMLNGLAERGVTVWVCSSGVRVSSPALNADDWTSLEGIAHQKLGCSFICLNSMPNWSEEQFKTLLIPFNDFADEEESFDESSE